MRRIASAASSRIRLVAGICVGLLAGIPAASGRTVDHPTPLLAQGQAADWWLVFKFNTKAFPGCTGPRLCPFGGTPQDYRAGFGQQFVVASKNSPSFKMSSDCAGTSTGDPLGATFDELYNKPYHFVIWNDQFYDDPEMAGCGESCNAPWGHSKGAIVWDDSGQGFVLQVSTPSWPAAGSRKQPRAHDGNTLGCVKDDNVLVSQHFFSLRLTHDDLLAVLKALRNASVSTDPKNPQIVNNGGPSDVQDLVSKLGVRSQGAEAMQATLSSHVILISKPSKLHVPPWQMVSSLLGGVPLRVASWWMNPKIDTTTAGTPIDCWDDNLGRPGAVEIASGGQFDGTDFSLVGGPGADRNHAKIGVSTAPGTHYVVLGDMNQQGKLSSPICATSQNGRGGLFFVLDDPTLFASVKDLIKGATGHVQGTR